MAVDGEFKIFLYFDAAVSKLALSEGGDFSKRYGAGSIAGCAVGAASADSSAGCASGALGAAVGELAAETLGAATTRCRWRR